MFRATKIVAYIRIMKQYGIGAKKLLAGTHIDAKLVSHPEYTISLEQYHVVVSNMLRLTNNSGIAFSLGPLYELNDLGIVGYAMISSSSLRDALDVWQKYANSLVGIPIQTETIKDMSPGYEVILSSPMTSGVFHQFETEELIAQGFENTRRLTGTKPIYGKASFSYPKPKHHNAYEKLMKCPIEFNASRTMIRYLEPDLSAPVRTMNEELFSMCAEHCHRVMRSLSDDGLLHGRLRSLFLKTPSRLPSLQFAGQALGLSTSTLCRQLDSFGKSYQELKDEFRFDLAREYLQSGHMSPKQVAFLLGFTSPSNFSRAFKVWSGQTVGQFIKVEVD